MYYEGTFRKENNLSDYGEELFTIKERKSARVIGVRDLVAKKSLSGKRTNLKIQNSISQRSITHISSMKYPLAKRVFSDGCHSTAFYKSLTFRKLNDRYELSLVNTQRITFNLLASIDDYKTQRSKMSYFEKLFFNTELLTAKLKYVVKPLHSGLLSLSFKIENIKSFNLVAKEVQNAFDLNACLSKNYEGSPGLLGEILQKALEQLSVHIPLLEIYSRTMRDTSPFNIRAQIPES